MPPQTTQTDAPVDNHLPYLYMLHMANKLHFHYTFEYLSGSDTFDWRIDEALNPDVSSIDELVKELEKKVNARVTVDRSDKDHTVLHLIDRELGKKSEVLDQKINLHYAGPIGEIFGEIKKHGVDGVELARSGFGHETWGDEQTPVKVDMKQQPVRDILTHCFDLDRYSQMIWRAETYQHGNGDWKTKVRFAGRKR